MIRRESVRVAVLDGRGSLLLLRTRDPREPGTLRWELPGGGVEPGEDPREAALRELREETGIEAEEVGRRLGVVDAEFEFEGQTYRQRETVFVLDLEGTAERTTAGLPDPEAAAHVGHRWWPRDEALPRVHVHPPHLARILAGVR